MTSPHEAAHEPHAPAPIKAHVKGPERRCVLTGAVRPRQMLLRLVAGPDGDAVPDLQGKLPGRGFYVVLSLATLSAALSKGSLQKTLRRQSGIRGDITLDDGWLVRLQQGLSQRALDGLGLARRAGQLLSGFDKVDAALRAGHVLALLEASDAGPHGQAKLLKRAHQLPIFRNFSRDQLGLALGRENVVHAALTRGQAAMRALDDLQRLQMFLSRDKDMDV